MTIMPDTKLVNCATNTLRNDEQVSARQGSGIVKQYPNPLRGREVARMGKAPKKSSKAAPKKAAPKKGK
jgi:hypothetical protein